MAGTTRRTNVGFQEIGDEGWVEHAGDLYRCEVYLIPGDGQYTVVAAVLPGISASSSTEDDAYDAVEALLADAIRGYKAAGQPIPWTAPTTPPSGGEPRTVFVSVV